YRQASAALDRDAFGEAGMQLAVCLRLFPKSGRAHFLAAQTALRSDQNDSANKELKICKRLGWPVEALRLEASMLAFQQGSFDRSVEQFLLPYLSPGNPDQFVLMEALAKGYM